MITGVRALAASALAAVPGAVLLGSDRATAQIPSTPTLMPGPASTLWAGSDGFVYTRGPASDPGLRRLGADGVVDPTWQSPPIAGPLRDVTIGDAGVLAEHVIERPLRRVNGIELPYPADLLLFDRVTGQRLPWQFRIPATPRSLPAKFRGRTAKRQVSGGIYLGDRIYVIVSWYAPQGRTGLDSQAASYVVDPVADRITATSLRSHASGAAITSREGRWIYRPGPCGASQGQGIRPALLKLNQCIEKLDAYTLRRVPAWGRNRRWSVPRGAISPGGPITRIAAVGGRIYFAGGFTKVDGKRRNGIGALDEAGRLLPFAPELANVTRPGRPLFALWPTFCPNFTVGLLAGRTPYAFDPSGAAIPWAPPVPRIDGEMPFAPTSGSLLAVRSSAGDVAVYPTATGGRCG